MKSFYVRVKAWSITKKIIWGVVLLAVIWGAYSIWFKPTDPGYQFATAVRGTLVQTVSVTGNTTPVHNIDLAFENGGTITAVNYGVGATVRAGSVIARLNTVDLTAQLAQAQANVDTQAARLRSLQAGSRPEDIQASQAALAKGNQDLANLYGDISDTLNDGYNKANDAVRSQLANFFTNAETNNPQLTFLTNNSQTVNNIQSARMQASTELNVWQKEVNAVSSVSPSSTLDAALQNAIAHLAVVKQLLTAAADALLETTNLSSTTINAYKTQVTTGLGEVNTANVNINTILQNIASQKITVQQLTAQLNLKLAGSTPEDIAAQQAQVEQAQASMASIQAKLAKASLVSPIDGTVTRNDAKVGQIASPGAALVSLISSKGLEVNAQIPEADIGKVAIGDPATMTLDAFQGKTFSGKVSYVNPGETVIEGVPTYKTTFRFDDLGPDVKPGMTANLDITTAKHDNVISIPQRVVTTSADGKRTVQVYHGAQAALETRTVTVGIRDNEGNIEIVSGLNVGEQVVRPQS